MSFCVSRNFILWVERCHFVGVEMSICGYRDVILWSRDVILWGLGGARG